MKIAIDFDDVIVDTVALFLVEWNTRNPYGYVRRNQINNWNMPRLLGVDGAKVRAVFDALDYSDVKVLPGAVDAINFLVDSGHDVRIVTANKRYDEIREWLSRNGLQQVPLFSGIGHKGNWLRLHNADVIIEDRPAYLKAAVTVGCKAIRFETPWNYDFMNGEGQKWGTGDLEFTANNWSEVKIQLGNMVRADVLDALSKMKLSKMKPVAMVQPTPTEEMFGRLPVEKEVVTTNANGAMQTKISGRYDLMDGFAVAGSTKKVGDTRPTADEVVTNAKGAKQTYIAGRYDLLPALAVKEVAAVLGTGAEKYGVDNWKDLSIDEILNHVYAHLLNYQQEPNTEELSHAATRILMALQLHLEELDKQGPLGA